jgi:hypothetical protein
LNWVALVQPTASPTIAAVVSPAISSRRASCKADLDRIQEIVPHGSAGSRHPRR